MSKNILKNIKSAQKQECGDGVRWHFSAREAEGRSECWQDMTWSRTINICAVGLANGYICKCIRLHLRCKRGSLYAGHDINSGTFSIPRIHFFLSLPPPVLAEECANISSPALLAITSSLPFGHRQILGQSPTTFPATYIQWCLENIPNTPLLVLAQTWELGF